MHETVVESLCDMPAAFRTRRDVSMVALIAESGYLTCADDVTEEEIERHLRAKPDLVKQWVEHSEDQRCTPARFLELPDGTDTQPDQCIVGCVEENGSRSEKKGFSDPFAACAYYIKRESESLRSFATEAS